MFQTGLFKFMVSVIPMIPVMVLLATAVSVEGAEPKKPANLEKTKRRLNLKIKTLGGIQLWSDVQFFHGWHIQQNFATGHYRLLDGEDVRHAWGTLDECRAVLDAIRETEKLGPMSGKAVILVHGIGRTANSMRAVRKRLLDEDYTVIGFNYASTRIDIPTAAKYLQQVIQSLEGIEEINFVVHSMGGLVVRSYLATGGDERIGRLVMLGVPNRGAFLAKDLKDVWLFKVISGPAGQQLAKDPQGFTAELPIPDFEFAVIAGSRGTLQGYNPLIPGDDDGTVAVESTRLPGATDFMTVQRLHSFMMFAPEVIDSTARFLKEGNLRKKGDRHPIPKQQMEKPVRTADNPMPETSVGN